MVKFMFWDVQHGSAAYIQTPDGKHIVIDLGKGSYNDSDEDFSPLLHLKNNWNVEELDAVIITHPHRDHLDDIINFDELSPKVLSRPKHLSEDDIKSGNRDEDSDVIEEYIKIDKRYNNPVPSEENPFLSDNNGGVEIEKFTPSSCATSNLNNHSIVTVISHSNLKILIPGDNEPGSWNELHEKKDFVSAIKNTDILVAPHHGRKSGFSEELFKHISPRLTIVSDGRFCDSSATDRYSTNSSGWKVHKRSGGSEDRNCITTRSDGVIEVEFGMNSNNKPYINVTIE